MIKDNPSNSNTDILPKHISQQIGTQEQVSHTTHSSSITINSSQEQANNVIQQNPSTTPTEWSFNTTRTGIHHALQIYESILYDPIEDEAIGSEINPQATLPWLRRHHPNVFLDAEVQKSRNEKSAGQNSNSNTPNSRSKKGKRESAQGLKKRKLSDIGNTGSKKPKTQQ